MVPNWLKQYIAKNDVQNPQLFLAALCFEVVGACFGIFNSFSIVSWSAIGLMPAFVSLMEVARPFTIKPILDDQSRLLHRLAAILALLCLCVVGYKNWSIQGNLWFDKVVSSVTASHQSLLNAEDLLISAEKSVFEAKASSADRKAELKGAAADTQKDIAAKQVELRELDASYHQEVSAIRANCRIAITNCIDPMMRRADERYNEQKNRLGRELARLGERLDGFKADLARTIQDQSAETALTAARANLNEKRKAFDQAADHNVMYEFAATIFAVKVRELSSDQLNQFRFYLVNALALACVVGASLLNAIAVWPTNPSIFRRGLKALLSWIAAKSPLAQLQAKVLQSIRAYCARKRRAVYRVETKVITKEVKVEVPVPGPTVIQTKIEHVPTEVPVYVDRIVEVAPVEVHREHHIEYVPVPAGSLAPKRTSRSFKLYGKQALAHLARPATAIAAQ
jgi:hypothetical protein